MVIRNSNSMGITSVDLIQSLTFYIPTYWKMQNPGGEKWESEKQVSQSCYLATPMNTIRRFLGEGVLSVAFDMRSLDGYLTDTIHARICGIDRIVNKVTL